MLSKEFLDQTSYSRKALPTKSHRSHSEVVKRGTGVHYQLVVEHSSMAHLILGMKYERVSRLWGLTPRVQKATEVSNRKQH